MRVSCGNASGSLRDKKSFLQNLFLFPYYLKKSFLTIK
ncbi:MAG: hypothetical protein ACI920_003597, partial [Saprospiraceae bacterium]